MPRDFFRLAYTARMSAEDKETGELMLYGEIVHNMGKYQKENYPEDKCAIDFDRDVKALKEKGTKNLLLRINSPGGFVNEAVAMRSILMSANFERIDVRIEGVCASAATLLACIPAAKVTIAPGSEYMIHNPYNAVVGTAATMEKAAEHLHQLEDVCRGFYAGKSGQEEDQIREWMDAEKWFTAEDAVKYGFADEVAQDGESQAVACVTSREMAVMRELYKAVPEIAIRDTTSPEGENQDTSHDTALDVVPTENTHHEEDEDTMDYKGLTVDQLRAENPDLVKSIQQEAMAAERQRCEDIDALTMPGYEEMAAKAKADGTSAMDFQRQVVQARKQKGADYLKERMQETGPAANVKGGDPGMSDELMKERELHAYIEEMKGYAAEARASSEGMF